MSDPSSRLNAALSGRYRIERELGEGGMATVYLARDLKHNRNVALKVLKPELAAVVGAERFLAEIETTANLQHPHILPLFDSGEADSFLFYVMPYVEGETVRQRLDREKQLPVDEAVRIATAVAGALDYAHRHGVVHRDVKPGNIMMQDGQPVVGDFGIALAVGAAGGARLTETGLSVGTPHYMSPEQATGDQTVGPATDIYALGCVLYEMLVGEPPFTGSTPQAVLGKIIMGEVPSAKAERASVPPNVDAVIAKALEKVPADRFGGAQDLATALGDASFRHGAGGVAAAVMSRAVGPWKWLTLTFAALSLVLAVALVLGRAGGSSAGDLDPLRIAIGLPAGESVHEDTRPAAISPDGRSIAYVGRSEDGIQLFHKALDQLDGVPIPGTDGATQPFFSPDGEWIGFYSSFELSLKKVPVNGGSVEQIAYVGNATLRGADWAPNDTVYFMDSAGLAFEKVAASGGTPIVAADSNGSGPNLLPDRKTLLFQRYDTAVALNLESGRRTVLVADASSPQYASSGHLLYVKSDNSLYAAPFDLDEIQITGSEVRVAGGVARPGNGAAAFWLSDEGTLLYLQEGGTSGRTVVSVTRDGVEHGIPGVDCDCWYPRYSPDGQRLLLQRGGEIWVYDLRDGSSVPITSAGTRVGFPSWVPPEGDRISFLGPVGDRQLYRTFWSSSRGGGELERLTEEVPGLTASQGGGSWSLDGRYFVFSWQTEGPRRGADLYVVDMDDGGLPERLTEGTHYAPAISPDGRWIAHSSRETGREEISVRRFPEGSNPVQVSRGGGRSPLWAPDMSELYYREGSVLVAVRVETEPDFSMLDRRVLFDGPYLAELEGPSYDVHPSGDSFAMTKLEPWEARLVLVQNFFEELKRLVPN